MSKTMSRATTSTSVVSGTTDSYHSKSLPVERLKMPSHSRSSGAWWKRVEKKTRSKKYLKGRNWLGYKRRSNSRREFNYHDNIKRRKENQGVEAEGSGERRERLDARGYREWLSSSHTRKDRKSDSDMLGKRERMPYGVGNVDEVVAENCLSCSRKKQRLNFDTKQECCICSTKPGNALDGTSLPKVVNKQARMVKSPPKDETVAGGIEHEIHGGKEDGVRESISRFSVELAEEDTGTWGETSLLKTKTDGEHNATAACILGGKLLCCEGKGCQKRYHLSCLNPPFNNAPPGVWHCICCVKKKIELGVHSVSKGVESIWDVREAVSDQEEMRRHKEYLVKYHGLAHIYNQWIPETKLLLEVPKLVVKFNRENQAIKWKTEWTVPQRLLQKRLLLFGKHHHDECCQQYDESNSDCKHEWLVKWTGLSYEHATWELEDASFLTSPEAMKLIRDYESRHEKAGKMASLSQTDEEGKANFPRLSELSFRGSPGAYNHHLSYVNKLYERWNKGQNAIVVDDQADQERIVKVILFILSVQHTVRRPFLIISTSKILSVWEAEFLQLAPSANCIVYWGNKDVRSSIRSLEFYTEGGQIMFEVLLSSSNTVIEDLDVLKCIEWKMIIIDECQRSSISKHFKQLKLLTADTRLLLVSTQIKDCLFNHLNILSLLDSELDGPNSGNTEICSNTTTSKLKETLAPYTAYECKSGSFRFVEYWVPVQLSNVQLEQYCAMLLSNSMLLCSCLKNDPALREIIVSIRKCCDHPYLLDQSLRSIVRRGLPIHKCLDAEIQVSGKLLLLDKLLLEIKSQDLRALIIFQSVGGSGRDSIGDILEDFVRQRFGKDCYVRIDAGVYARSKKQAALKLFNNKQSGKFVFLIENRACLPSIRLSLVDAVILFDSDWDPQNDIRALHRMTISSQFEQLKVFRLYTCCTVEEIVLILAKKGEALDNTIDSMNRNTCHMLLNWGASHLFNKLDNFHEHKTFVSGLNIFSEDSFLDGVLCELTAQFPFSSENKDPGNYSFISRVRHRGGTYSRNVSLIGEKEMGLMDTDPLFLWKNLLKGRHPRWRFLSESSSRVRRKVQSVDKLPRESKFKNDAVKKRSWKEVNNKVNLMYQKSRLKDKRKLVVAETECKITDKKGSSSRVNDSPAVCPVDNDITRGSTAKMVETRDWSLLKLEITKLCDILKLPENIKDTAMDFLEHIIEDYNVSWETDSTLRAFQISLCWTAASLLKHKIDHRESLVLAKLHLKFDCKEEEANYIFSKLQKIEKSFACHMENVETGKESNHANNSKLAMFVQKGKGSEEELALMRLSHAKKYESTTYGQGHLEEGELLVDCCSEDYSNQLMDLEEGEIPPCSNYEKNSKSTSEQQDLEEGELTMGSQSQNHSDELIGLEDGDIPMSLSQGKSSKSTSSGMLDLEERELAMGSQSQRFSYHLEEGEEISITSNHAKNLKSTTHEQRDFEEEIPMGSLRESLSVKFVDLEEAESAIRNENQNTATMEQTPSSGILDNNVKEKIDDSNLQTELLGKNTNALLVSRAVEEQVAENPVTYSVCLSDSDLVVDKMQPTDISRVHVGSRNAIPETLPSLSNQNHCGTVPNMMLEISDNSPNEKELCSFPAAMETIIVVSDSESEGVEPIVIKDWEPIVIKDLEPTCSKQNDEGNSSTCGPNGAVPTLASLDKQSPVRNAVVIDSVLKPPGTLQTQPHEVVMVDDHFETSTALERANASEVKLDGRVDTPICVESPTLVLTGTSSCMVQQEFSTVQGNSFPSPQLSVSTVPSISTFIGTPCHQIGGRCASSQEAQVSRQPFSGDLVQLLNSSVTDFPVQPSIGLHVGGTETCVQDLMSRSNVQDFSSTASVLGFLDDHLLHHNRLMSEIPLPAFLDPLKIEMQRIQNKHVEDLKMHEEMVLRIKSECDKEIEEVYKKYDMLLQGAEAGILQKKKDHEIILHKVYVNRLLAKALVWKPCSYIEANSQGRGQATVSSHTNPLIQPPIQQTAQIPATRSGQFPVNTPVASSAEVISLSSTCLSTSPVTLSSSPIICFPRSLQGGNEVRAPSTSHLTLSSSPIMCFPRNHQGGNEVQAPAPHLQASRLHSALFTSNLPVHYSGMSNQQFPGGSTETSMMQMQPAPTPTQLRGSYNLHLLGNGGSFAG